VLNTLRAEPLGTYAFPHGSGPNIDALAAKSVVFDDAIAASSRTALSHASMMTSRFARKTSIAFHNGTTRFKGAVTLAGILKRAGYRTGAFIGNMLLHSRLGMDHGFDVYDEDLSVQEKNRNEIFERRANQTVERAIEWVNKEGLNRLMQYQERYTEEIAFADPWIGQVVKAVNERSSPRETIVSLTADHGEAMGKAGRTAAVPCLMTRSQKKMKTVRMLATR
jgi:arylsulfatase A-like enzyme